MNFKDALKDILKDVRLTTDVKIMLAGLLMLCVGSAMRDCAGRKAVDTTEIDKEIAAAKVSLFAAQQSYDATAAKRDMYRHKCDSLVPVFGVEEAPADRARKDAQWRQYRDSVSKYGDKAIDLEIARDFAKFRVDTLESKRKIMKMR